MAKDLQINPRIVEQLSKATVKNIVDGIVELVTNSDDSYKRLEEKREKVSGEIKVSINKGAERKKPIKELKVEDFAEGMTKEELEKSIEFGGLTSGFESGRSVRGLFGRGLKETIIALGEGEIEAIKNGRLSKTKIWFDTVSKKPKYDDKLLDNVKETKEKNGTKVVIKITNAKIEIPGFKSLREQISKHYALRDINNSKDRNITLDFRDWHGFCPPEKIKFEYPKGKKVKEEDIVLLQYGEYGDKVGIVVYESHELLDSPRNNPSGLAGILIKTKGAILDNQIFKFVNDDAALYFFGEALCEGLEDRLRKGETEIIDPNRGGLEWRHEYCIALSHEIENILEPLVIEKRKKLENRPRGEVKKSTSKMLEELRNLLNEITKQELEDLLEPSTISNRLNIEGLVIIPSVANILKDEPRTFSIYASEDTVKEEGYEVHIKSDTIDIHPLASTVNLEKHKKYPKIWYRYFKVVGTTEDAEGTLTIHLGESTASAKVKVAPFKDIGPRKPRRTGFISEIIPDELDDPPQRASCFLGRIRIYVKFPSVAKFIGGSLERVENPESRVLLAELVGDAFCGELARKKFDKGEVPHIAGGEIDAFNNVVDELQKKYLHKIQEIIFNWDFRK